MLKFLRKYNKFILVIGGAMLMVAFLAPQAIQQLGTINDPTVGRLDGRNIKQSELIDSGRELRALNALGGTNGAASLLLGLSNESSSDAELHWLLLTKEAEEGGFVGSDLDGRSFYPLYAQQLALLSAQSDPNIRRFAQQLGPQFAQQIIQQQAAELTPQWLERLEQTESMAAGVGRFTSLEELHRAVAKLRGVIRMRNAYGSAAAISEPRLVAAASDVFRGVIADAVVVPAERYLSSTGQPTEAQIAAHFQAYADTDPAEDENGIGYRQPPRVKIEWIEFNAAAIADEIDIPAIDLSEHWQLNRDRFPGEFGQERDAVDADLRRERVEAVLDSIDRYVRGAMLSRTRDLTPVGDAGYFDLPADWSQQRATLETIALEVANRVEQAEGIELPEPTIERRADSWQTRADLETEPAFATSQVRAGSVQVFGTAAPFQVRELLDADDPAALRMPIQTGVLAANFPLIDAAGNRRFFRVLDARDTSPPDSLDEVRDQVVENIRRLEAFDTLLSELEQFALVAEAGGLEAVVDAMNAGLPEGDDSRVEIAESLVISTDASAANPPALRDPAAIETVLAAADRLDPTAETEALPLETRVFTATSPLTLNGVVGVIDTVRPLTVEQFRLAEPQIAASILAREQSELGVDDRPFSLARLIARHGWQARGEDADQQARAAGAAATEAEADQPQDEPSAG
ncbi:MAG: hypothetical protein AAGF47_08235 [Planctomycetota bacterium]